MNKGPRSEIKKPTINDVARLSGVSKKTVSRVINNSPLVTDATRRAVKAVMEELNYANGCICCTRKNVVRCQHPGRNW